LLGHVFPIKASLNLWLGVLFVYCFFASVIPVNLLLQPRDYLSSFLLFFGLGAGYLGVIISRPVISMPLLRGWSSRDGYLWPFLFVTVACGAVSGFHALIASGTSSKQIASERHVKRIGYGGMVAEGLVAVMAIIATAILFKPQDDITGLFKSTTPINIFGKGYNFMTRPILGGYGGLIAITILNAFILTTLDTATRISRYLTEELFRVKNRYLSTAAIVLLCATLALSGKWNRIWPIFGASNQLVAALALFVLSCWLMARHKPAKLTLLPALFMLVTTVAALFIQTLKYFKSKDCILSAISILLIILAIFMLYEIIRYALTMRRKSYA